MKKTFSFIAALFSFVTLCSGQANTKLSNLVAPTKVNVDLLPGGNGKKDFGSNAARWKNGFFDASVYAYGVGNSYGVYGTAATYGVYGYSSANYGVYGSSSTGYGVVGSSGYIGTYGSGSSYGFYGVGGTYGAYASGSSYGVYGKSTDGYGVAGVSTNSYGVYASGYDGTVGYGSYIGAYGSGNSYGLYGSGGSYGAYAYGTSYGVYGTTTSGAGGYFFSSSGNAVWANNNGSALGVYGVVVQSNLWNYGGSYGPSDKNLKKNIVDFTDAMSIINKLKPKNYEYRTDGNLASLNLPKGTHYGLIAQDLEQVLPNLVAMGPKTSDKDVHAGSMNKAPVKGDQQDATASDASAKDAVSYKGINYTELIPIMIKGMQELDKKNTALAQENDLLKSQMATLQSQMDQFSKTNNGTDINNASLNQNYPNPFKGSTVISFNIPKASKNASVTVSETGTGKTVKTIAVSVNDNQLTLNAGSLSAGSYMYTLYVDGKKIDSKQMVVNR